MDNTTLISVVIVTYQRPQALAACLKSLQEQQGNFHLEVLVVLNGPDQEAEAFLSAKQCKTIVLNKRETPAMARNIAGHFAQGTWLLFLDDDVELPQNYFSKAQELLNSQNDRIDVLGGPDQTPPTANEFERALGLALSSPMSTAHTFKRHQKEGRNLQGSESTFILCHLWIKREVFKSVGFDERFFRNEENVLLFNLRQHQMLYSPDLFVYHERKSDFLKLFPAVFSSGRHRVKSFFLYPKSFKPLFLLPLFFLFYILSLGHFKEHWALFPLAFFMGASLYYSFKRGGLSLGPAVLSYQLFINVAYALGTFWGLVENILSLFSKKKLKK